mmetsp:Transcript_14721/g.31187  ORF Transcript_14721/g.31187 Transcript_14721/m.31187 type:complete len:102 (+) Transcript_14721:1089-1394(+)
MSDEAGAGAGVVPSADAHFCVLPTSGIVRAAAGAAPPSTAEVLGAATEIAERPKRLEADERDVGGADETGVGVGAGAGVGADVCAGVGNGAGVGAAVGAGG